MRFINTVGQLHALQTQTHITAVVFALLLFALAFVAARLIRWQGGQDRSYVKRRWWWIGILAGGTVSFWLYNQCIVMDTIKKVAFQNQFAATNAWATLWLLLVAVGVSVAVMFVCRHGKFGSILGKEKNR